MIADGCCSPSTQRGHYRQTKCLTLCKFLLGENEAVHRHMITQACLSTSTSGFSLVCRSSWTRISSRSSIRSIPVLTSVCTMLMAVSSLTSSLINLVISCPEKGEKKIQNGQIKQVMFTVSSSLRLSTSDFYKHFFAFFPPCPLTVPSLPTRQRVCESLLWSLFLDLPSMGDHQQPCYHFTNGA